MTNREQPNENLQQLADMIRNAGGQHSGNIPVEQGGERPVNEYDNTTLDEAVGTHIDPEVQPDDTSTIQLQPHETAAIDQSTAARRPVLPPTPPRPPETTSDWASRYDDGRPNHTKRNAVVAGSLAGTLAIAAITYFALRGNNDHNPTDASEGHLQPGVSAPAKPGKATSGSGEQKLPGELVKKQPLVTVTLDPRISTNHTKLTDNQLQEIQNTGRPDAIDKQLAADIPQKTLEAFLRDGGWSSLLDKYPNWDALYQFHDHWEQGSTNNDTMSSYSVIDGIYNDNYVLASQLYGQPQQFRNPQTAALLGKAPIIGVAELNKIAKQGGDSTEFWKQTIGRQVDYERVLLSELDAGDTDPSVIDRIISYAVVDNHSIGAVGQSVDEYKNLLYQDLEKLYNRFMADPKKTEEEVLAQKPAQVTTQAAFLFDYHRQLAGYPQENDTATNAEGSMTITNGTLAAQSIIVQPDGKKVLQTTVSVVEFVSAPTSDTKHDYVMPVIVDQVSQTQPYQQ